MAEASTESPSSHPTPDSSHPSPTAVQPAISQPIAPLTTPVYSSAAGSSKPPKQISCVQCQARKVKCNKEHPKCSACTKSRLECIYRPPAPPRRGVNAQNGSLAGTKRKGGPASEAELLERLRRCEDLLARAGVNVDDEGNRIGPSDGGKEAVDGDDDHGQSSDGKPLYHTLLVKATDPTKRVHDAPLNGFIGENRPSTSGDGHVDTIENPNAPPRDRGSVVIGLDGKEHYVESHLWNGLSMDQVPRSSLRDVDVQADTGSQVLFQPNVSRPGVQAPGDGVFIFDTPPTKADLYDLHPSEEHSKILWRLFLNNINPLIGIVHAPTFGSEFLEASRNLRRISDSLEALMFSIYAITIYSISPAECEDRFGMTKSALTAQFDTGTKKGLINAGILKSSDFRLLQAFVLWLLSIRQSYDPRSLWTLTGIALRLGQRQGLHRERALKTVSIFEAEMRRRVWWQILQMDNRAAELSGSGVSIFVNLFDTNAPRNLNDRELYPTMEELPPDQVGATDSIFVALRAELGTFLRRSMPTSSNGAPLGDTKDEDIDKFEQLLESKYLRFCDAVYPLHFLTSIVGRAALTTIRLIAHHPSQYADGGATMSQEEKEMLFLLSMKLLRYDQLIRSSSALEKYLWHCEAYFPWHALIYILCYISKEDARKEDAITAWEQIQFVFDSHPHVISDTTKPLHIALGNLTLKAWDVSKDIHGILAQKASSSGDSPSTPQSQDSKQRPLPYYITALRAQRAPRFQGLSPFPSRSRLPQTTTANISATSATGALSTGPNPYNEISASTTHTPTSADTFPNGLPTDGALNSGRGSSSFFPFIPAPTTLAPQMRKYIPPLPDAPSQKHPTSVPPSSSNNNQNSNVALPQAATYFPPDAPFPQLAGTSSTYLPDPMAVENMAMDMDIGMNWAEWDRLLMQDDGNMLSGPAGGGFGVGIDEAGGLWRETF